MRATMALLVCLGASTAPLAGAAAVRSPIAKVISMLSELQAKILKEGEVAQQAYEEYAEWCEDRSKNVGFEIKTGKMEVEDLTAVIESAGASIDELSTKIEETASGIAVDEADLKAATEIRQKETADFAAKEAELVDVIDTLERAITILERELGKGGAAMLQVKQAKGLAQALNAMVDASMLGTHDATRLQAFVQASAAASEDEDDMNLGLGAPDPAAYKSKSGSIVETLEGLLEKAKDQLAEERNTETNNQHNFEMLAQSLNDEMKYSEKELAEAKKGLAASKEEKATAEGDLAVAKKALEEDEATHKDLHKDCMERAQDFEAETKSRGEELEALAAAKKVISESTDGAGDVVYDAPALFQIVQATGLSNGADLANFEAVRFVRELARKQHSPELAQLATRMAAAVRHGAASGDDPFGKVKELIKDMIERLLKDAQADASHKAYCDKEMGETIAKKEEKEALIAKLTAKIDSMSSRSESLKAEVATLQSDLAALAKAQAEMDALRQKEKATYEFNKGEVEEGLEGVKLGLKILREYYAQEDKAHAAAEGAGNGVIGLLEVVESDFTKSLAEMSAAETSAASAYDRETKENEIEKATKEQDVKYKTKEFTQLDSDVAEATSDRAATQEELSAVLEYKGKLVDICVAKPESYAERAARREAEIAGLKEALEILDGEAVLLQRGGRLQRGSQSQRRGLRTKPL